MENYFGKTTLITPDRESNLDLPVIGSLVYLENSARQHCLVWFDSDAEWFLATVLEVPDSILGTSRYSMKQWIWNGDNSAFSIMRTCQGTWFSSRSVLVPLLLFSMFSTNLAEGEEACETLPSELHIIKEEFDELGRLQRTCNSEVSVNKCEGACNSQVQPSVITPTGFLKECYCCRESFLRERVITLTHCYDPDGGRLTKEGQSTMDIKLREPAECKCFKCGDFSR
uniref:Bursicon subunit beta n=1 Tax=Timema shepardi TaxID=629360 RepID=A0A7R9AKP1_TIMSH|nr:unnamed protein product [Timema shepardi]